MPAESNDVGHYDVGNCDVGHHVTLLTRAGCHLCDDAQAVIERLAGELGFRWDAVDVDGDERLRDSYGDRVPVIMLNGAEHGYWRVEEDRLRRALERPPAGRSQSK